ncbi:MAG: hypothetical protein ACK4N5_07910, partial [Myxococcales bacterium]
MRLYRRAGCKAWYCEYYDAAGKRHQKSTRCRDRQAAEKVARQWERAGADPADAAARATTLTRALELLVLDRAELAQAGKRSEETVVFYTKKAGHLRRVLGADTLPLLEVTAARVDEYISARRAERASESTIYKELVTWRSAMRIAKRRGLWSGDIDAVFPRGFSPEYEAKDRALHPDELRELLGELVADRAAQVAF